MSTIAKHCLGDGMGTLVVRKGRSGSQPIAFISKKSGNSETVSRALGKFDFLSRVHIPPKFIFFVACLA